MNSSSSTAWPCRATRASSSTARSAARDSVPAGGIRDRLRRQRREAQRRHHPPALVIGQRREEGLPARRAVEGHMRAHRQLDPERPVGLDPVAIGHPLVDRNDVVHRLADRLGHAHQDLAALDVEARGIKCARRKRPHPPPRPKPPRRRVAHEKPLGDKGLAEAMDRGLRQAKGRVDLGRRERTLGQGHDLEHSDRAQIDRDLVRLVHRPPSRPPGRPHPAHPSEGLRICAVRGLMDINEKKSLIQ